MTISAKIIQDSFSYHTGVRLTTFEFEYPRFIHSEFMTHHDIVKNSASSRAIPVKTMIENVRGNPAMPIHWGKAQAGMQANEENYDVVCIDDCDFSRENAWSVAVNEMCTIAEAFAKAGYHKQIVNRLTEVGQHMKVVATGTNWQNFFWLRDHADAQPEIHDLASKAHKLYNENTPFTLYDGELHVPYLHRFRKLEDFGIRKIAYSTDPEGLVFVSPEDALKISASMCAQVSYRKSDDTLEKAMMIYSRLVDSKPVHASPFEHQGICFDDRDADSWPGSWPDGITHMNKNCELCSGNLRGWIQHRQLIPDNYKVG